MAAKGQKVGGKGSRSTLSNSSQAKGDPKNKKKVTLEGDDETDEKEGSLAYKVLSEDQCKTLLGQDVVEMQTTLCDIFKLHNYTTDLRDAGVLDYYTGAVWWGKEQGFQPQQLSGFFTVIHTLLDNVKEQHMAMIDNLREFKKMLIGIDPEYQEIKSAGLDFFNTQQAKALTNYVTTCLFQHYKLYELMFTQTQAEEIIGTDLEIETAKPANVPFPPPLDEGVSQEMFASYIATPPPTPEPEVDKSEGGLAGEVEEEDKAKEELDAKLDTDIFSELTVDDVREVIESVAKGLLDPLQSEIAAKLREKENILISRINKVHKVAEEGSP
ncbi:ciliary-associated calcium-binding coiled-coil protein 1-like isoform X2 [Pecten maximus]|uniref:ciliary-associated calcium-binding coiled-coil protein 1-like isoform X2 n=1 Tax=Pecten maximus TaxID=6579 RepID=UPI001458794A|nr:ciliary-associated calcium-binding coiled-coil protein 1-like isoform X2 [Pecten maximus]